MVGTSFLSEFKELIRTGQFCSANIQINFSFAGTYKLYPHECYPVNSVFYNALDLVTGADVMKGGEIGQ
jgi:hypothetical protein